MCNFDITWCYFILYTGYPSKRLYFVGPIKILSGNLQVPKGKGFTLICMADSGTEIKWILNGFLLEATNGSVKIITYGELYPGWGQFSFGPEGSKFIPQSHRTHSHYVLQDGLRTACCQKMLNRFKVLDILACSVTLHYVNNGHPLFEQQNSDYIWMEQEDVTHGLITFPPKKMASLCVRTSTI